MSKNETQNSGAQSQLPSLSVSTVVELEAAADVLLVDEPEVALCEWLNLSAALLERAKQVRQRVEQVAIGWISNNGPVEIGDMRYAVGFPKTVRCTDPRKCIVEVLDACGGDVQAVTEYLRSDSWKYGSIRSLLGEAAFEQIFRTESKPKLVEGQPRKELLAVNTRFAVGRGPASTPNTDDKAD